MNKDSDNTPSPDDTTEEAISPAPSPGSMSDPLIGTKIGSCTLKRIIGSGGMGTVYEAIQEKPRRRVALKMMKRGITSRSATRRFEFESQTLARLKHQGVAQVYEAGTHDSGSGGVPYFVMEYVPNAKSITQYADEKNLGTRKRLALFSKVCDAVQHGHLKGIVHRDLKPGNILIDPSGQPKVIDFGVARSTDSDMAVTTLQTDVGQLIGTLQYMSPEQCEADPSDIDVRSDVYSLGVILYELLTGKPPYDIRQVAIHEAVRIVREEEPTKLSTIDRHLRGDIETIAHKALEKERDQRYQSTTSLQEDIEHYLSDEPISAKPPGAMEYLRRFAKRYRAAAAAILAVLVVLFLSVVGISIFAIDAQIQRKSAMKAQIEAVEQRKIAEEGKESALRQAYYGNIQAASTAIVGEMSSAHLRLAQDRLAGARNAMGNINKDELPFEWQYLNSQFDDSLYIMPAGPIYKSIIYSKNISFNPDGTILASCFYGPGSILRIQETSTGMDVIDPLPFDSSYGCGVTFSPDGKILALYDGENTIRLLEISTGKEVAKPIVSTNGFESFAFSPNGNRLATTKFDTIRIWSTTTGEEVIEPIGGHEDLIKSLDFSPDGALFVTGSYDKTVRIWDATNGKELATLRGHGGNIHSVAFSPDGSKIVSQGRDGYRVWDVNTKQQIAFLDMGNLWPNSVTFSSDGSRLATGPYPLRIWDTNSWKLIAEKSPLSTNNNDLIALNFDGSRLARVHGMKVEIYKTQPRTPKAEDYLSDNSFGFTDADLADFDKQWHETGTFTQETFDRLEAAGIPRHFVQMILESARQEDLVHTVSLSGHSDDIGALAYTPEGGQLATASADGTIRIWEVEGNYELDKKHFSQAKFDRRYYLPGEARVPVKASINPGFALFSESGAQIAVVFEGKSGARTISSHTNFGLEWIQSPRPAIPTIKLLDAKTGSELAVLDGHELEINSIVFSGPNESLLASGSDDHTVRIWDTNSGKQLMTLFHNRSVHSVAFNIDGTLLASCDSRTAKIWDPITGEELSVIPSPIDSQTGDNVKFWSVSFTPDGHLVFCTTRGVFLAWNTQENVWEDTQQFLSLGNRMGMMTVCQSTGRIATYDGTNLHIHPSWREPSPEGHKIPHLSHMEFTKDGTRLVTGSSDGIISIWDSEFGEEALSIFPTSKGNTKISSVSISPDSSAIVAVVKQEGSGSISRNLLGLKKYTNQSLGERVADRRMYSQRKSRLTPLVEDWMEKSGRDCESVLALLERQCKHVEPDDAVALTNLVLDALEPTSSEWNMQQRIKVYPQIVEGMQSRAANSNSSAQAVTNLKLLVRFGSFSNSTFFDGVSDTILGAARNAEKRGSTLFSLPTVDAILFRRGEFNEIKQRWEAITTEQLGDSYEINRLVWRLAGSPDELESGIFAIISDEALRFAQKVCELTDYKDTTYLNTLARVHFNRSELDEAIYWQEEVVKLHEASSNALGKRAADRDIATLVRYQSDMDALSPIAPHDVEKSSVVSPPSSE